MSGQHALLNAVKANTRKYYWTGRITTKGGVVYDFAYDDMVKGGGYITSNCCGSAEVELGTMYAAEMGIFEVSETNRKAKCLEIKAYDYMVQFEKAFNRFEAMRQA